MPTTNEQPAGRPVAEFCRLSGISRPWFYQIMRRYPGRIDAIKIGSKVIVLTEPRDFLNSFRPATTSQEAAQ